MTNSMNAPFDYEESAAPAPDLTTVLLVEIPDPSNRLDPNQIQELSRRLTRVFGYEHFDVGRSVGSDQSVRWAMREIPPMTKRDAERIGHKDLAHVPVWFGSHKSVMARSGSKGQLLQIAVKTTLYTSEVPSGDWALIAMIYDFLEVHGVKGNVIYGCDHPDVPFVVLDKAKRDFIHQQFLTNGRTDVLTTTSGAPYYVTPEAKIADEWPHRALCHVCSTEMTPLGYARDIDGRVSDLERHRCSGCGERLNLLVREGEEPKAWWLGNAGRHRYPGPVRLVWPDLGEPPADDEIGATTHHLSTEWSFKDLMAQLDAKIGRGR